MNSDASVQDSQQNASDLSVHKPLSSLTVYTINYRPDIDCTNALQLGLHLSSYPHVNNA